MVKKRMAMRMLTIFVALIVCGMFFPDLARGADLSSDQGLEVKFPEVVVGEQETMSVGITNETDHDLKIWLALNKDAGCPEEYFTYTGPIMYPDVAGIQYKPGETLTVEVTFSPSEVGVCTAFLQITPMGTDDDGVTIYFTAEGVEKTSETFEEIVIGGFPTGVFDKMDADGRSIKEMIGECEDTACNRGHLVRCVSWITRELRWEGSITYQEKCDLRKAAVRAEIHKIMLEMKAAKRSGKTHHSSRLWRWRHSYH